jgi:FKBP12-rapamycin complex-associated protein
VPSLISVHNFLGQPEAANGVLRHASKALNMQIKDEWYEKLQRWGEAYAAYARRAQESRELGAEGDAARLEASEGQMRCLRALGEWDDLRSLADECWPAADARARERIAPLAAAAACQMGQLEQMGPFVDHMAKAQPRSRPAAPCRVRVRRRRCGRGARRLNCTRPARPPPPLVLSGHAASLTPY